MVLTHNDIEGGKLHGLIRHSQHYADSSNLQGGQVELQRVLGTHSVNDTVQAPIDSLSSTRTTSEMPHQQPAHVYCEACQARFITNICPHQVYIKHMSTPLQGMNG